MTINLKIILVSVFLFVLLMIFLVMGFFNQGPSLKPIKTLAPYSVQLIYPNKEELDSKILDGQYYMVSFMASWCGHCIEEIATLASLERKIPVPFLAVVVSDDEKNITDLFKQIKNPFDYIGMNNQFVTYNFGNFSLPQTYIVNDKGEIVFKHAGVISKRQFEEQIIPFLSKIVSIK
jgi:cytochrome c biogenesis protein CcmG/thiol:disulfide interchange protein DsbE